MQAPAQRCSGAATVLHTPYIGAFRPYIGAFSTYNGLKLKHRMNTTMLAMPKIFWVRDSGRSTNTGG